jgi:hypothetical protein
MRSSNTVRRSFTNVTTCWTVTAAFGLILCSAASSQTAEPDAGGLEVRVRPNSYRLDSDVALRVSK